MATGSTSSGAQVTQLLSNALLGRVERMRINAYRRFTNRHHGEHLRGKGGQSTDFADYRNYAEGDDIRHVDWNIFSRLHKPYLKVYHQEEQLHVVLLIDSSASMDFEGKFTMATQLASAFGVMGMLNQERVSVFAHGAVDAKGQRLAPRTGRGNMFSLFDFIENLKPGGNASFEQTTDQLLKHHRGRGVIVLLSDFLTYGDVAGPFNKLVNAGLEIFALQILSPSEIDPQLNGDWRFVDSENQRTLDVTAAGNLLGLYNEYRLAFEQNLVLQARKRQGRAVMINSNAAIEHILLDQLTRKGWVV